MRKRDIYFKVTTTGLYRIFEGDRDLYPMMFWTNEGSAYAAADMTERIGDFKLMW